MERIRVTATHLFVDAHELLLRLELEFTHANEVLADLCQALLAFVDEVLGPVLELLVNLRQRLERAGREEVRKSAQVRDGRVVIT